MHHNRTVANGILSPDALIDIFQGINLLFMRHKKLQNLKLRIGQRNHFPLSGNSEAASEEHAPVILQVSAGARKYARHAYLVKLVEAALMENDIPIALHLDHGADFDICKACIDGGFSSVMIDGSHHSFEDNIALTKKVVDYAHAHGWW